MGRLRSGNATALTQDSVVDESCESQVAIESLADGSNPQEQLEVVASESMISVPVAGEPAAGYLSRTLHARLSHPQASILRRIFHGLREKHATLRNGHHVDTPADAVRWLLESAESGL